MIIRLAASLVKGFGKRFYCKDSNQNYHFHPSFDPQHVEPFKESFLIYENLLTEDEEANFMTEMEPHLKRHIYEKDHWDDAIQGFRETERKFFNKMNTPIVERIKSRSFPSEGSEVLLRVFTLKGIDVKVKRGGSYPTPMY